MKEDASRWYKAYFSKEEHLTVTWDEFIRRFNQHFISSAARAGKEAKLLALEKGELSVTAYENRFVTLCHFTDNMFQTEERKARMFEKGLRPQIKRYLVSQRFPTQREVADAAIAQETFISTANGREAAAKIVEKDRG